VDASAVRRRRASIVPPPKPADSSGDLLPSPDPEETRPRPSSDPGLGDSDTEPPRPAAAAAPTPGPLTLRDDPSIIDLTPEQAEAAAAQFERARLASLNNNHDYAVDLLFTCCRLDPLTPSYRQKLREVGRNLVQRGARGGWLAGLKAKARFKAARRAGDLRKALEAGEEVLFRNPRDWRTHLDMAEVAEGYGLRRLAVWVLDQARLDCPDRLPILRNLARLLEDVGDYNNAIRVWEAVRKVAPADPDAGRKVKDLAAHVALARSRARP
jgi:tetratricopeptide (TPR) repeat protein